MYNCRLLFTKTGPARYISHLDLMRTFQRIFLRAGYLLQHSQGFHPHPEMSILLPLPVGQSSECEMIDFSLETEDSFDTILSQIQKSMPEGLTAVSCQPCVHKVNELYALEADVVLEYDRLISNDELEEIKNLFQQKEILVEKKTKHKGLTDIDIVPRIFSLTMEKDGNRVTIHSRVSALEPGLNPVCIGKAVERYLPKLAPLEISVHRKQVFLQNGEIFQ